MSYQNQTKQLYRILDLVKRLCTHEVLHVSKISKTYNVSSRTLSRDMQKIAKVFPLENNHGKWRLHKEHFYTFTNNLNHTLISSFAKNIDIEIACLDKSNSSMHEVEFAIEYHKLPKELGEKIIDALHKEVQCSFTYVKSTKSTSQRQVDPIRLYTEKSRWYLIARDYKDDKVKTFLLSNIQQFKITKKSITLTKAMQIEADNIKNVWSSGLDKKTLVKLHVKPKASPYIEDIKLHHTQEIIDRHYDGGLEVHCTITHKLEILPSIKSWLPHVHIIEPKWLEEDLMKDLDSYRDENKKVVI
jgi:predicted DNA-binding transcriptional regulator YafY